MDGSRRPYLTLAIQGKKQGNLESFSTSTVMDNYNDNAIDCGCVEGLVLSICFAMVTEDGSQSKLMEAPSLPSLVLPRVTDWWKVLFG